MQPAIRVHKCMQNVFIPMYFKNYRTKPVTELQNNFFVEKEALHGWGSELQPMPNFTPDLSSISVFLIKRIFSTDSLTIHYTYIDGGLLLRYELQFF